MSTQITITDKSGNQLKSLTLPDEAKQLVVSFEEKSGAPDTPPATPDTPDTPPTTPDTPDTPPATPDTPDTPPTTPDTPDTPPATPDTPDTPPATPDTPDTPPATPDTPDTPPATSVTPDTPPVIRDVDVVPMDIERLKDWIDGNQEEAASPTPGKQIREVRVESWLQVPEILRALHNNEGPLRITYPEIKNSAIAAEQTEISKFLIGNAGQNLAGMLADLEDKIKNCHMMTSGRVSKAVAKEYLQSFSETISVDSSPLLTVAEVVRLNDSFKPLNNGNPSTARQKTAARDQILATITETMAKTGEYHTCIIEVPTSHVEIAKMFIKQKWEGIDAEKRPETQHTKVWVADEFVSSASITEYDFEKFLDGARDVPEPKSNRTKKNSSSTPPGSIILDSSEESRSSS